MWQWKCGVVAAALVFAGCASGRAPGSDDDSSGVIDAAVGGPDAKPGSPDAAMGSPDAMMGAPDAMMSMVDAMPAYPCASGQACLGATTLGTVSGDTGNDKLSASGSQSAWYRVRVNEDDSDIFGLNLRVSAKLTSPAAADFDVFIYVNTGSDVIECSTTIGTVTTVGAVNTVKAEWGEGSGFSNGSDDGRNVSIEVRNVSGVCSATSMWQLEVEGDWP